MAKNEIHLNDIGTIFEVTVQDDGVVVDISGATTKEIIFKKSRGEVVTKPAVFTTDGVDGKMRYVAVAGDLDERGQWELQAHVVLASGEWRSDVDVFTVFPNL